MVDVSEGQRRVSLLASKVTPGVHAVLLTRPENIYYFTGFRTTLYTRFTAALLRMDQPFDPVLVVATIDRRLIEDRVWSPPWLSRIAYHGPEPQPLVDSSSCSRERR